MGKIAQSLIDEGVQLGVSSRGMGSLRDTNEGYKVVGEDFMLATAADIVADPSAPDAFVNGIMEGVEWIWDAGLLKAQTSIKEATVEETVAIIEKELKKSSKRRSKRPKKL